MIARVCMWRIHFYKNTPVKLPPQYFLIYDYDVITIFKYIGWEGEATACHETWKINSLERASRNRRTFSNYIHTKISSTVQMSLDPNKYAILHEKVGENDLFDYLRKIKIMDIIATYWIQYIARVWRFTFFN